MSDLLSTRFLTTHELAQLLHIRERKVYELAASGEVPCSRATGKLLFPRREVEAWIARNSSGAPLPEQGVPAPVFAGSHDPLLEWALRESRAEIATFFDGSLDGVARFSASEAMAVAMHIYEPDGGAWNVPLVAERFAQQAVVLVEFAWRERGLVVVPGQEGSMRDVAGLRGRRVVPRQPEAGSQRLLEHLIATAGLGAGEVVFTGLARTETDAVLAVADDKAEAAFGLQALARQFRLGFVPILVERFDLLVDRRVWFEPPMQRLIGFCGSPELKNKAEELGGYDVSGFGRVHFNGA